jgi:hypothetical protein
MSLKWKEPCSTKKKIISLLIELGFFEGTKLHDWVQLANENFSELNNIQAEEKLKELQSKHNQVMRLYNQRWLVILKPYKN